MITLGMLFDQLSHLTEEEQLVVLNTPLENDSICMLVLDGQLRIDNYQSDSFNPPQASMFSVIIDGYPARIMATEFLR